LIGLDVYYNAVKGSLPNRKETRSAQMMIDLLQPYMDRGELGMKTGKGFYAYPNPSYGRRGFLTETNPREDIYKVLANGVVIRAVQLAEEGIADFADIDRIWMINMKSNSGPFAWLDQKGMDVFLTEIESEERNILFPEYDRDQVRRFLDPFVKKGQTGIGSGKGLYTYPNPVFEAADFLLNPFQPRP